MISAVNTAIDTPPQGSIPAQELTPTSKPQPKAAGEVGVIEASEIDISGLDLPRIDTLPMTLGSQRPIQGYSPIGDLPLLAEENATVFDLGHFPLFQDQQQLSTNLVMKGTNLMVPLSLPPVGAGDAVKEATLATYLFGNNGPSIATPGSARRAAVEQSASTMKSVIVKAFNRSIPFTDLGNAQRTFVLGCYEAEIMKLQVFWQSLDVLRGYAEYLSEQGIPLDETWLPLYDPDLYTALVAVYNSCQDLLVYDTVGHKRIEKLGRIFTASKRNSVPGTCIMQDILVAESSFTGAVTAPGSSTTVDVQHPVPNFTMAQWFSLLLDPATNMTAVQTVARAIKDIRVKYEVVITALAQLVSKGALAECHLREFIPAQPEGVGFIKFADSRPSFSHAFHERFEYAPETLVGEVGGTATTSVWNINDLPDYATLGKPSACISRRPVGKCHGSEAFTIAEVVDVGLFKNATASGYAAKLEANTIVVASSGFYENKLPLNLVTSGDANACTLFVDAVYGDLFIDGTINEVASATTIDLVGHTVYLHGLSYFPTGTGIHNVLPAPCFIIPRGTPVTVSGVPGMNLAIYDGGTGAFVNTIIPAATNTHDVADVQGAYNFLSYLMEELDLAIWIQNSRKAGTGSGSRLVPLYLIRGYALSGYYSYSLAAVDNAVGLTYLQMVPEMVINFARKG